MGDESTSDRRATPVAYANHVNVGITVYDFALSFGIGSNESVTEQVTVHMSPQHAKSLHLLLGRFLSAYEKQVGQISLPETLMARLTGQDQEESDDDAS